MFKYFNTYVAIYWDFTETYGIVIAYTEMELHTIKWTHVLLGYKL